MGTCFHPYTFCVLWRFILAIYGLFLVFIGFLLHFVDFFWFVDFCQFSAFLILVLYAFSFSFFFGDFFLCFVDFSSCLNFFLVFWFLSSCIRGYFLLLWGFFVFCAYILVFCEFFLILNLNIWFCGFSYCDVWIFPFYGFSFIFMDLFFFCESVLYFWIFWILRVSHWRKPEPAYGIQSGCGCRFRHFASSIINGYISNYSRCYRVEIFLDPNDFSIVIFSYILWISFYFYGFIFGFVHFFLLICLVFFGFLYSVGFCRCALWICLFGFCGFLSSYPWIFLLVLPIEMIQKYEVSFIFF